MLGLIFRIQSRLLCVCATEPIVPDLTEKLDELKRIREQQSAKQAEELQEAEEKYDNMKELLLTENALLRQSFVISTT